MRVRLAEAVGPGVDMRIKMQERERADAPSQGAQQRQRHAVVAAEGHKMRQRACLAVNPRQGGLYIAERHVKVADIGKRQGEWVHPVPGVSAVGEHVARLANGLWTKARTAAIGRPDIERYTGDADVGGVLGECES